MLNYKLLINGHLVDGDLTMEVINPATEAVLAACPRASEDQLNQAVAAARRAFPAWSVLSLKDRRAKLMALADAIRDNMDDLARLLTAEQGKPLQEARDEITETEEFTRYFAALDLPIKVLEESDKRRVEEHRKPLGVVGAITPWNFPALIMAFKVPAALLAGNTVVIKPAPTTPLTTLKIGELMAKILPPGVVNIITDQNDLGALLTRHPDVAKISFTGSSATGAKVMESAAETLKRLTLELGGNDAAIVLDDVELEKVAQGIFQGAFSNAGQVCLALKRLYVHESVYDALCDHLATLANKTIVDDGLKQGVQMGPIQNKAQYEKVKELLEDARANGTIIAGGEVMDRPGYFIRPTIVRDINDDARLVVEEQFGPILPVIKFSQLDDAVNRANASPYGLGGSVWSGDVARAYAVAQRLETGTVWVNAHQGLGPKIPFGGAKRSGIGTEFGQAGLEEFTQRQIICTNQNSI